MGGRLVGQTSQHIKDTQNIANAEKNIFTALECPEIENSCENSEVNQADWFEQTNAFFNRTKVAGLSLDATSRDKRQRENTDSEDYIQPTRRFHSYSVEIKGADSCINYGGPIAFTNQNSVCTLYMYAMSNCEFYCTGVLQRDGSIHRNGRTTNKTIICGTCKRECRISNCCDNLIRKEDAKLYRSCARCRKSKRQRAKE